MRSRHDPAYLADNIIRTDRFDANRDRLEQITRDYDAGMRELNARYSAQLEQTRGSDAIGEDVRAMLRGLVCGLVAVALVAGFKFRIWEWMA